MQTMIPESRLNTSEQRAPVDCLTVASALVRDRLQRVVAEMEERGTPGIELEGQLLRPLAAVSLLTMTEIEEAGLPFWRAVLAVQMAHEASLVHDDVIDEATSRRGRPTVVAQHGVANALIRGDQLLAGGYRLASETGSLSFARRYAEAVDETIAGEVEQGGLRGTRLDLARSLAISGRKSGELIGCAMATSASLRGDEESADAIYRLGRRVGVLYQMLDDFLDYCPTAGTGKPALGDYGQKRWTWVLSVLPETPFGLAPAEVVRALHLSVVGSLSPMRRLLDMLRSEGDRILADPAVPPNSVLPALVRGWTARAEEALELEAAGVLAAAGRDDVRSSLTASTPTVEAVRKFLDRNSRSFGFASRFLPAVERAAIGRVYAYCRMTDDLVDGNSEKAGREAALEEWLTLSRQAYDGMSTGLPLLDLVMEEMRSSSTPFEYAEELIAGMRMDLSFEQFATMEDLQRYTYRVASVVGLWVTRLSGVHDNALLDRAAGLGHAMQLTNIIRDVGEDLEAGRIYLPIELMGRHGVSEELLWNMHRGQAPITPGYAALLEEVMESAELEYARSFPAIAALPRAVRAPFAIAAGVYRGIHSAVRKNGHDNLRLRAHTSLLGKCGLAYGALAELTAARRHAKRSLRASAPAAAVPASLFRR